MFNLENLKFNAQNLTNNYNVVCLPEQNNNNISLKQ